MSEEVKAPAMSKQKQNQLLQKQKQKEQQQQKKNQPQVNEKPTPNKPIISVKSSGTSGEDESVDVTVKPISDGGKRLPHLSSSSENKLTQKHKGHNASSVAHPTSGGTAQQPTSKSVPPTSSGKSVGHLAMFDHLQRKQTSATSLSATDLIEGDIALHPATIKLGSLYRLGCIREDDDRVSALLATFSVIIKDYSTPPNKSLSWDLDKHIRVQVQHLVDCRQHSMGMGNVIKFVRYAISQVPPEVNEAEAKSILLRQISTFCEERIEFARESIVSHSKTAIRDGDVVLTFGSSCLVRQVLLAAAEERTFRVVVVDARPLCDGLRTLRALSPVLPCVYCPLSAAAVLMRDVTRVFLGASALLANGAVVAAAGTAMVAALAKERRIPVIVVAESYKFCEKVQLDAIVSNELGAAAELVSARDSNLEDADKEKAAAAAAAAAGKVVTKDAASHVPETSMAYKGGLETPAEDGVAGGSLPFQVINLRYDLTPIDNVSVVATEAGFIPPTSVPVLISELRVVDNETDNKIPHSH